VDAVVLCGVIMDITAADILVTAFGILVTALIFIHQRRRNSLQILEQSFEYLQRINEKALENDANLEAAMRSIRRDEEFSI
jgi:hypothetical protein